MTRMATCHPDRAHWARGMCSTCYSYDYASRTGYKRRGGVRTREQNRIKAQVRRAVVRGLHAESITTQQIGDRDAWHCGICAGVVSPDTAWPSPSFPTLDHMVPIAHGGTHTAANVRLAHMGCNSRRGVGGDRQSASVSRPSPAPRSLAVRVNLDPSRARPRAKDAA